MSLLALKQHLCTQKMATAQSLCQALDCDLDMLEDLAAYWIQKGKMKQQVASKDNPPNCFACPQACQTDQVVYSWL